MDYKNAVIGALVGLVVLLGGLYVTNSKEQVQPEEFGALSSPDISSPYLAWGGLRSYQVSVPLNTATTTPCAIQSPAATSTLSRTALRISTATSTATVWTVATAATAYATTTPLLAGITLASGIQGTMFAVASTTDIALDSIYVLAPNTYVVWGVQGTVIAGTANLNGFCQAEFLVI